MGVTSFGLKNACGSFRLPGRVSRVRDSRHKIVLRSPDLRVSCPIMPRRLQRAVLAWYRSSARDLPWRRTEDPYSIWVSEVMLQQTRVETVVGYYERFLRRFPTLESLARARLDSVLGLWQGLGYYARARNLHRAARESVRAHGGFAPSHEAFRALPGVGAYTAAAVWAVAFGEPRLPLDGNIRRVLSRVCDIDALREAPYRAAGARLVTGLSRDEVSPMVQGLMELGALVCTPSSPECGICPVRSFCRARALGTVGHRPPKKAEKVRPHLAVAVACLWNREGKILLQRRPREGFLGGLWELPGGKIERGETPEDALRRELREELGLVRVGKLVYHGSVDHAYSHFSVTLHLLTGCTAQQPRVLRGPVAVAWADKKSLARRAVPRGTRKVLALLQGSP
jgi:A/G-specific adenine glycosylase